MTAATIVRELSTQTLRRAHAAVALCCFALSAHAQMSILPPQCIGKSGEALDKCVREITAPQYTQRLEPVELKADPMELVNCLRVGRADQEFCIQRNEVILECRNRVRHPDLSKCLAVFIARPTLPRAADCSGVDRELRNECVLRNKVYGECVHDLLRYFICLGEKMSRK